MKTSILAATLALMAAPVAADIQGFTTGLSNDATVWNAASRAPTGGNVSESIYVTSDNCSYRKTQAPGHPPMWILIVNPHHLGLPNAHRGCRGTL
ncbi:hypothetical protein [Puniceibacterium sp. IMCC21224]|uniref:hypothetical protein n=1 Tax=Puniceibacterium sp. IMCC21224 TaxID=1618204 RepID=UPI00065D564E|nr:hypothetical protein [Puniceibacterium sp. IMCC21224]KMK67486.1 hypothetical protein IMCC21224_112355 [Puniceibacterium sp. IMCC21224]